MNGMTEMRGAMPQSARPADLWRPRWAAFCLVCFLMLNFIGLNPLLDKGTTAGDVDGNIGYQLCVFSLILLLMLTTWRPGRLDLNIALPWPLIALLAYCLVTLSWSMVPMIGLRRLTVTVISMWVLFRSVGELGYGRTLYFLRQTTLALLIINYLAVIFTQHGIHHFEFGMASTEAGSWRGIMMHKNIAGSATGLTAILFAFDRRGMTRLYRAMVLAGALVFLALTQSKTSIGSLGIALAAGYAVRFVRISDRSTTAIYAIPFLAVLLPLIPIFYGDLIETLNDPDAFTGRMQIWSVLLLYARDHFWTGAGYSSFWGVGAASPVQSLNHSWVAEFASAGHNGYLDLLVTIGFPGLVLAVLVLLILPLQRLLLADHAPSQSRSLLFAMVVFCLCNNMTESQIVSGRMVDQMFLSIVLALIPMIAPSRRLDGGVSMVRAPWRKPGR